MKHNNLLCRSACRHAPKCASELAADDREDKPESRAPESRVPIVTCDTAAEAERAMGV